jgi:hypothetical protein
MVVAPQKTVLKKFRAHRLQIGFRLMTDQYEIDALSPPPAADCSFASRGDPFVRPEGSTAIASRTLLPQAIRQSRSTNHKQQWQVRLVF